MFSSFILANKNRNEYVNPELRKRNFLDYFIVLFAFASVHPFFGLIGNTLMFFFVLFLIAVTIFKKDLLINKKIILVIIIFYLLIVIQAFIYKGFTRVGLVLPLNIILIPYLIYRIMGLKFLLYSSRIVFWITAITLPIWFMQSLSDQFDLLIGSVIRDVFPYSWSSTPRTMLIYTSDVTSHSHIKHETFNVYRNSGVFHEPGAYGVFLVFSIIINHIFHRKLFSRVNIVLLFALLTTFSTAAYISIFTYILFVLLASKTQLSIKIALMACFIIFGLYLYNTQDFLKEKVNHQYESQYIAAETNAGSRIGQSGRFFALFTSLKLFMQHPLFGRGIIDATGEIESGLMHKDAAYKYGITGFLSTYGIFFGLFFLIIQFLGYRFFFKIKGYGRLLALGAFLSINMELQTQTFFLVPFFVFFFIIGLSYKYSHFKPIST